MRKSSVLKKLDSLHKDHRLSQEEISNLIGISPATVSRWLSRTNTPRGDALQKAAEGIKNLEYKSFWEAPKATEKPKKATKKAVKLVEVHFEDGTVVTVSGPNALSTISQFT
jgi:transcriptional regulator with XRE-family HTH domain